MIDGNSLPRKDTSTHALQFGAWAVTFSRDPELESYVIVHRSSFIVDADADADASQFTIRNPINANDRRIKNDSKFEDQFGGRIVFGMRYA